MIVDVNVNLSRWPFRRLPGDETAKLVKKLASGGVGQAWAGSFDGMFHKDVRAVNARLVAECQQSRDVLLRPFGTVNPTLPDWREDLRQCHESLGMPGIRLCPSYHGYQLDHPSFSELLTLAERRNLIVQLVVRVEDPRMQHPLMRVADVDTTPLPELVADRPQLRLVLLNALRTIRGSAINKLTAAGNISFEISMLEGMGAVAEIVNQISIERLLFGSHFPFFVLESAILKLQESELKPTQVAAITHRNALRLCSPVAP